MKTQKWKRITALMLTAALALATPALALFGKKNAKTAVKADAPVAREIEVVTYRNIPYYAQFLAADGDGENLTFKLRNKPKHGTVKISGADFVYTPKKERTGSDSFTYFARDSKGHTSAPATVSVEVKKTRSGVTYSDTNGCHAAAAAQQLAEDKVFTGSKIGSRCFFEPQRAVSRSEFLAMTMETAKMAPEAVTMTGFCDDAAIPTWAKAYAETGLAGGLVKGVKTADGVAFHGEKGVTFNEAAAILNRVLAVNNVDLQAWYAERHAVPSWAAQAVGNLESVNVMAAGSFGSRTLNNRMTRADAASMLAAAATLLRSRDTGVFSWLDLRK